MEKKETTCTIRLEDQLRKRMKDLAQAHTRSLNEEVLVALRAYVKRASARDVLDKSALYKPHTPNRLGSSHSGLRRAEALCCQGWTTAGYLTKSLENTGQRTSARVPTLLGER